MQIEATYIGVATVLLRIGELTILTDPAFGAPGLTVTFAPGARSSRLLGPAIAATDLPPIDAVLLSHDRHIDNLDPEGRALLPASGAVLTTRSGARRLRGNSVGLRPFESHELARGPTRVTVTATPARHGPRFSLPFVGRVIGFLVTWQGQRDGAIYISGDTVRYAGIDAIAARGPVGTAFLHMGGAALSPRGAKLTMTARDAAEVTRTLGARRVLPIHSDGWTHFRDDHAAIAATFAAAGLADTLHDWQRGDAVTWEA
ncbi:MAG: MBL fold metallo-hydrolase [Kofleriaceae bacterium]